jgi:cell division initiation protein
MAENEDVQGSATETTPDRGGKRLTPVDVQQKQFRLAFRGYHEREVDEFLDQMTEELARLHAENRRLQEEVQFNRTAGPGSPGRDAAQALNRAREEAARLVAEAQDRAGQLLEEARRSAASVAASTSLSAVGTGAGDEGLNRLVAREKEFLQRLAALIQGHAEAVKDEVRTAKEAPAAPVPAEAPAMEEGGIPEVAPEPDASTFVGAEATDEAAAPVLETGGPAAWESEVQERSEPGRHEAPELAQPSWASTPAEPTGWAEPEAAWVEESTVQPEAEPEPERVPEPPPDLMPADADLPEPTRPWHASELEDTSEPVVPAEPPMSVGADLGYSPPGEPSATEEELSPSDAPASAPSEDAWPPVAAPQEPPAEAPQETPEGVGEFEPESEPEPETEQGSSLFDQPTPTDEPPRKEPEPDWGANRGEQGSNRPSLGDPAEREGEEDQSLRELFWGEES